MKKLMLIVCLALSPVFGAYAAQPEGKYDNEIAADHAIDSDSDADVIETPTSQEIHSPTPTTPARPSFIGRHPAATVAMTTLFSVAVLSYLMSGAQLGDIVDDTDARSAASTLHCALFGCPAEEQRVENAAFAARGILASIPAAAIAGIGTRLYIKIKQAVITRLSKIKHGKLTAEQLRKLELLKGGPSVDDSPEDSAAIIALYGKNFEDQLDKDLTTQANWQAQQSNLISKMQQVQRNLESKSVAPTAVQQPATDPSAADMDCLFQETCAKIAEEYEQAGRPLNDEEIIDEAVSRLSALPQQQEAQQSHQAVEEQKQEVVSTTTQIVPQEHWDTWLASAKKRASAATQQALREKRQRMYRRACEEIFAEQLSGAIQEAKERKALLSQYEGLIPAAQSDDRDLLALPAATQPVAPTSEQALTTPEQPNIIGQMVQEVGSEQQPSHAAAGDAKESNSAVRTISYSDSPTQSQSQNQLPTITIEPMTLDNVLQQRATTVATVPTDAIDSTEERVSTLPLEPMHHDPMKESPAATLSQQPATVVESIARELVGQTAEQPQPATQTAAPENAQTDSSFLGVEQLYI